MVCPFFRHNEDYCDVGCGYISPHDVKTIVAYCNCRFKECTKYQELVERVALPPAMFPATPRAGRVRPLMRAAEATMAKRTAAPISIAFKSRWPLSYQLRYVTAHYHETYSPSFTEERTMSEHLKNKGWTVVMAGTGINLALGILYAYSMLKGRNNFV